MFKYPTYDFIILGGGASGLSLLTHILRSEKLKDKRILVIDREIKNSNDRTWCFWEKDSGPFEEIVFRRWEKLDIYGPGWDGTINIRPYAYKMIRGIDFYRYCYALAAKQGQADFVTGELGNCRLEQGEIIISLDKKEYRLDGRHTQVFDSRFNPEETGPGEIMLLQHFKGWEVKYDLPVFRENQATLMDFRVPQVNGTAFVYVLPFDKYTALVEYTVFSASLLEKEVYNQALAHYLENIAGKEAYKILHEEYGVIPMTSRRFRQTGPFYRIGTAGGQTKASTGYTFRFIQQQSAAITKCLEEGMPLTRINETKPRFRFYDNTLLKLLYHQYYPGDKLFTRLFRKNKPEQVFRFLDNASSLPEEWRIVTSLPARPFLKAVFTRR